MLSEILIFPQTFFFVWAMVGAQPVPAVRGSQGIIQQLWIAGAAWAWASPWLADSWLSAHSQLSRDELDRRDSSEIPRNMGWCLLCLQRWAVLKKHCCWALPFHTVQVAPVKPFSWNPLQLFMLSFVLPNYTYNTEVLMWLVEDRARICICQTCFLTILGVCFPCLK